MIMLAHDFVDDALGAVYIVEVDLDTQYLSASGCMAPSLYSEYSRWYICKRIEQSLVG